MKQAVSRVRCPSCGKLAMKLVSRTIRTKVGRRSISVPDVEIEECANCGERLYDLGALRIIRRARQPARRGSAA
jgi:YgiT-type zinc finger domain-containing protein